jgi:hypothetical protein
MKKRQLNKLAKKGVQQMKLMSESLKIEPRKVRDALGLYLHKHNETVPEPKLYKEFSEELDRLSRIRAVWK